MHDPTIVAAHRVGQYMSFGEIADLASRMLERLGQPADNSPRFRRQPSGEKPLSSREWEVLRLVAEGLSNKGIGARLSVSPSTVTYHLANIFQKLGASNRAQAVAVGFDRAPERKPDTER